ncbi:MAG: hypothetical protein H7146_12275 [Burkholderiaceae bacterium]|nr:hypothetical protein [Microbacteriaceae bacterium]
MGSNRRYERFYDEQANRRMEAEVAGPRPLTLTAAELELERFPATRAEREYAVETWIRYEQVPVRVRASVIEWNDRAVHVRWAGPGGAERDAWVWASSVTVAS